MTAPYVEDPAQIDRPPFELKKTQEEAEIIFIGKRKFVLDRNLLKFSEANINETLMNFAAVYDEYSEGFALSQAEVDHTKNLYESVFAQKFSEFKQQGDTEKLANSRALNEPDVQEVHEKLVQCNYRAKRLNLFLRSLDYSHGSLKEFCYNLRKELDKIYGSTIRNTEVRFRE